MIEKKKTETYLFESFLFCGCCLRGHLQAVVESVRFESVAIILLPQRELRVVGLSTVT